MFKSRALVKVATALMFSLAILCAVPSTASAGELWERYQAQMQPQSGYAPVANPGDPERILSIGMYRSMSFYQTTPEYEVLVGPSDSVLYRGIHGTEKTGDFRGILGQKEFEVLAEYVCKSDFFELPERIPFEQIHYPTTTIVVRTALGEKWVSDENWAEYMHPTTWAIGRLIDGMLFSLQLSHEGELSLVQDFPEVPAATRLPKLFEKFNKGLAAKVVCFGDSVTGVYYHTGGRRAYTDVLQHEMQRHFPSKEIVAINAGVSGNTTKNALERIETDVIAHNPDLVTVMFGLNDMTRVPLEEYRANLKSIVEQCRAAGAEVILCTSNNVVDTPDRPTQKLLDYIGVVREVAAELNTPLGDCYERFDAIRAENPTNWALLMSDEIHPNMSGHREIAYAIEEAIVGISLARGDYPAPQPAIPHTLELIRAKQPIEILAMPPYDELLGRILNDIAPQSQLTITPWEVAGKSLDEIEESARAIRDNPPDWVFIAVPHEAEAADFDAFKRHFTWTMNYALSFKLQEWDVTAVPPGFLRAPSSKAEEERDGWARTLIRAQDFDLISGGGNPEQAEASLRAWLAGQLAE